MNNNNEVGEDSIEVNCLYEKEIKSDLSDKSKPPMNQDHKSSKLQLNVTIDPSKNFDGSGNLEGKMNTDNQPTAYSNTVFFKFGVVLSSGSSTPTVKTRKSATHSSDARFNALSHSMENVDSEPSWKK